MAYGVKIAKGNARKAAAVKRRHIRVRKRVSGTPERPRLVVKRSSRHIHVQLVDDTVGRTLANASTLDAGLRTQDELLDWGVAADKPEADETRLAQAGHTLRAKSGG